MLSNRGSYPSHLYGSACSHFDLITDELTKLLFSEGNDKAISDTFKDLLEFKGVKSVFLNIGLSVRLTNGSDMSFSQDICQGGIK